MGVKIMHTLLDGTDECPDCSWRDGSVLEIEGEVFCECSVCGSVWHCTCCEERDW